MALHLQLPCVLAQLHLNYIPSGVSYLVPHCSVEVMLELLGIVPSVGWDLALHSVLPKGVQENFLGLNKILQILPKILLLKKSRGKQQ